MNNYMYISYMITRSCPNFNDNLVKPLLKVGYVKLITSPMKPWMWFLMPQSHFNPVSKRGSRCMATHYETGLILGLRPANERRRYFVTTVYHWLGTNLVSATDCQIMTRKVLTSYINASPWGLLINFREGIFEPYTLSALLRSSIICIFTWETITHTTSYIHSC